MTPDQLQLDEAHAWLTRAHGDLRAAQLLIAGSAYCEALFHCQQAVEKALKGFLTFHQRPFRKTHVLGELSPACLEIDPSLRPALERTDDLTQYAWRFRYPGAPFAVEMAEANSVVQRAEGAVLAIGSRLPPAVPFQE
jgi:HEPN domain-containing protein